MGKNLPKQPNVCGITHCAAECLYPIFDERRQLWRPLLAKISKIRQIQIETFSVSLRFMHKIFSLQCFNFLRHWTTAQKVLPCLLHPFCHMFKVQPVEQESSRPTMNVTTRMECVLPARARAGSWMLPRGINKTPANSGNLGRAWTWGADLLLEQDTGPSQGPIGQGDVWADVAPTDDCST